MQARRLVRDSNSWREGSRCYQKICKSLDLILRTTSDLTIHPTAEIIGEADPLLSMTALQAAAGGGRKAIIDKSGPLAKLAAKR